MQTRRCFRPHADVQSVAVVEGCGDNKATGLATMQLSVRGCSVQPFPLPIWYLTLRLGEVLFMLVFGPADNPNHDDELA